MTDKERPIEEMTQEEARAAGRWLEVVGWNEKCKCNTWAEKKRQFSPRPSYEWVLRSIEAEEQMRRTRALHQRLNRIEL